MKLVVGLGNPGSRYQDTRHNIGFMAARHLVAMIGNPGVRGKFDGEVAEGVVDGVKAVVLCPSTFMNASGRSVRKAVDFYKIEPADVLVICDDLNLPLGQLRIRAKGSSGGQKGLNDIIRLLGTDEVPRLRIGIDPPPPGFAVVDYVLSKFGRGEEKEVQRAVELAAHASIDWIVRGIQHCMNQYNVKKS
jgi:PTH1 family peptidyl-tRNA hydrolase